MEKLSVAFFFFFHVVVLECSFINLKTNVGKENKTKRSSFITVKSTIPNKNYLAMVAIYATQDADALRIYDRPTHNINFQIE